MWPHQRESETPITSNLERKDRNLERLNRVQSFHPKSKLQLPFYDFDLCFSLCRRPMFWHKATFGNNGRFGLAWLHRNQPTLLGKLVSPKNTTSCFGLQWVPSKWHFVHGERRNGESLGRVRFLFCVNRRHFQGCSSEKQFATVSFWHFRVVLVCQINIWTFNCEG